MMLPPAVMSISIKKEGARRFRLWLPVVLLWPLIFGVMILFAPVVLVCALLIDRKILQAAFRFYALLCALRGLRIDAAKPHEAVHIYFV